MAARGLPPQRVPDSLPEKSFFRELINVVYYLWEGIFDGLQNSPGRKTDGYIRRKAQELQTTDNTQTTIDSLTLEDDHVYHFRARVTALRSTGADRATYEFIATVYRTGGGGATIQGSITAVHTAESNASLAATFTVSSNDVRVSVTGITGQTFQWACILEYMNMST